MNTGSDPRATLAEIASQCNGDFIPPETRDGTGVFEEPWQATAFALTVALHQRGFFSWPEWAATLTRHIKADPDDGRRYYQHWLSALEDLIQSRQLGTSLDLAKLQAAWAEAAERTPHGQPIEL